MNKNLSWGLTFLFISMTLILTEKALRQVKEEGIHLQTLLKSLEDEKAKQEKNHELLVLQIHSASDPAWIELVLKRELGLTPEGQTKVVFK